MNHNVEELKAKIAGRRVVASISGGKDSAAMSLYLSELGIDHDRVFMDTGWEHPATYEYLRGPLTDKIGPIQWLEPKRKMEELILHKGMFPSRMRRYCTQELKVYPMKHYVRARQDRGDDVINTVGIRAGESESRSKMPEWEWQDGFDCEVWRPLIHWSEQDVIDIHSRHGLVPNPLYLKGAQRVGCWPCIYAKKSELRLMSEIDPARVDAIAALESAVSSEAESPRAWFQAPDGAPWPIAEVIKWSKTSRGGKQFEMFAAGERDAGCMRWGLCETNAKDESHE